MQLPSGKTISDKTLREIAEGWVQDAFLEGNTADYVKTLVGSLSTGNYYEVGYDEADRVFILDTLEYIVMIMFLELKEAYGKIYEKHLATRTF